MHPEVEYLTPQELVDRWRGRVSMATLRQWRWAKNRKGPPWTKVGAHVLYPVRELEAWEASMRRGARGIDI